VKSDFLGYAEKIKHLEHNVMDMEKVPKFAKKVYLETVDLDAFGEPVNQPL
jgi:hypothetical protein